MLGLLGFTFLAVAFGLFAVSVDKIKLNKKIKFKTKSFAYAYVLMVGACAAWAFALYIGTEDALLPAVIIGDVLLVASTILLLESFVDHKKWKLVEYIAVLIGAAFIVGRLFIVKPEPYIMDGFLIFNSSVLTAAFLVIIFFAIWFNASYRLGSVLVTDKNKSQSLRKIWFIFSLTASASLSTLIILKDPLLVSVAFLLGIISYLSLAVINMSLIGKKKLIKHK